MVREKYRGFLVELAAETKKTYGDRLVTLSVFGSVGRMNPRNDSDIDLLIVAENLPTGRMNRMREFAGVEANLADAFDRLTGSGVCTSLSPVIKTPREVERGSLLFLDMIEDSIYLYDRDDFFKSFLGMFQKRLEALGARRIRKDSSWHWVLKGDYQSGEVFEL